MTKHIHSWCSSLNVLYEAAPFMSNLYLTIDKFVFSTSIEYILRQCMVREDDLATFLHDRGK